MSIHVSPANFAGHLPPMSAAAFAPELTPSDLPLHANGTKIPLNALPLVFPFQTSAGFYPPRKADPSIAHAKAFIGGLPSDVRRILASELVFFAAGERQHREIMLNAAFFPTTPDHPRKTLFCFEGLPGSGKTTHIDWLREGAGMDYCGMHEFALARGVTKWQRIEHQLGTGRPHPLDDQFLNFIFSRPSTSLIIDKFPRTPIETLSLRDRAAREGWDVHIVHLDFLDDPFDNSVRRQMARKERPISEHDAYLRTLSRFLRNFWGLQTAKDLGMKLHPLDASLGREEILHEILGLAGSTPHSGLWDLRVLKILEDTGQKLGASIWMSSGNFYRPLFNNRFGPPQEAIDVDLTVEDQSHVIPVTRHLLREYPETRWSVYCPMVHLNEAYGIETRSPMEAKAYTKFLHKGGFVGLQEGRLRVFMAPGAAESLRHGVVSLNSRFFEALPPSQRKKILEKEVRKILHVFKNYPALRADEALTDAIERIHGFRYHARPYHASWQALKKHVADETPAGDFPEEYDSTPDWRFTDAESAIAEEIIRFHRDTPETAETAPLPRQVPWPEPLETIRRAREKRHASLTLSPNERRLVDAENIPAPKGFASWFEYMAIKASDAQFGNWLIDQGQKRDPIGGQDPELAALFDISLFTKNYRSVRVRNRQSPMHQGWPLERHLEMATLQLHTDDLLKTCVQEGRIKRPALLRASIRMAMLFHDTGKLFSDGKPGVHAKISARLWKKHHPAWFPKSHVDLVAWMIRTHDVIGRFGRGLMEKEDHPVGSYEGLDIAKPSSYRGAIDLDTVRAELADAGLPMNVAVAINKAIWKADAGSVPTLRWLLPTADMVGRMILLAPMIPLNIVEGHPDEGDVPVRIRKRPSRPHVPQGATHFNLKVGNDET